MIREMKPKTETVSFINDKEGECLNPSVKDKSHSQ